MTRLPNKTSKRMLFTYFMLGGGIFLFTPPSLTGRLQLGYARLFRGPLHKGRVITLAGRPSAAAESAEYNRLTTMQRRLRNQVANLQAQLEEARRQIDVLSKLRCVPEWNRMSFQLAGIINDPSQTENTLLINRGRDDGVAVGQFVLGDISVIGTVCNVSAQTARVRLITDPESEIAVRIGGIGAGGLMTGGEPGLATISIPLAQDKGQPKTGDPVYALKTPGFPGVPIIAGEIVDSHRDQENPLVWKVRVLPVCDIADLRDVAVVMSGR